MYPPHRLPLELVIILSHNLILPRPSCPAKLDHLNRNQVAETGSGPEIRLAQDMTGVEIDDDGGEDDEDYDDDDFKYGDYDDYEDAPEQQPSDYG